MRAPVGAEWPSLSRLTAAQSEMDVERFACANAIQIQDGLCCRETEFLESSGARVRCLFDHRLQIFRLEFESRWYAEINHHHIGLLVQIVVYGRGRRYHVV